MNTKAKYIFFFISVIILYHLILQENYGDTINSYQRALNEKSLFAWCKIRYMGWSSRTFIDAPMVLLSRNLHTFLWSICNILVYLICLVSLMKITDNKSDSLIIGLFLLYNTRQMASAGWIPTYMNYFWPLSFGILALVALHKIYKNEEITIKEFIVYSLCTLYSTNCEQFNIMYLCILCYFCLVLSILKSKKTKRQIIFILIQYILVISNFIYIALCPGNKLRFIKEMSSRVPDYITLSTIDKLVLGFNDTFSKLSGNNLIFFVFCILLSISTISIHKKINKTVVIGSIPLFFVLLRTLFKPITQVYFRPIDNLLGNIQRIDAMNYFIPSAYFPFLCYTIIFFCIFYTFINCFTLHQGLYLSTIFITGLTTRLIMGFSPTLYASSNRTFIFFEFALIFCTAQMFIYRVDKIDIHSIPYKYAKYTFLCLVVVSVFSNIIDISFR